MTEEKTIPYIAHESEVARLERVIKRLWILCIIIFLCLIGTNAGWLYYESQWEDMTISQDVDTGTGDDISYVDKLTHAMKSIKTTMAMIESEDEYSNYGGYDQNGGGSYRNYPNGGSYARGRGNYAKRDSRGRYSSYGYSRVETVSIINPKLYNAFMAKIKGL